MSEWYYILSESVEEVWCVCDVLVLLSLCGQPFALGIVRTLLCCEYIVMVTVTLSFGYSEGRGQGILVVIIQVRVRVRMLYLRRFFTRIEGPMCQCVFVTHG